MHQSGSSRSRKAKAARPTEATAENASATGGGTRRSPGPAAQAQTCAVASAIPSRASPNGRCRGRTRIPQSERPAAPASPRATRTEGPSQPLAAAQLRNMPAAASTRTAARASIPYRPTTTSRLTRGFVGEGPPRKGRSTDDGAARGGRGAKTVSRGPASTCLRTSPSSSRTSSRRRSSAEMRESRSPRRSSGFPTLRG